MGRDQELHAACQHQRRQPASRARVCGATPDDQNCERGGGGGHADCACRNDRRPAGDAEQRGDGPVVQRRLFDEALAVESGNHARIERHFPTDLGLPRLIRRPQAPIAAEQREQCQCQRRQQRTQALRKRVCRHKRFDPAVLAGTLKQLEEAQVTMSKVDSAGNAA